MKLVADANVLFALSKPSSTANEILSRLKIILLTPDFALVELYKYKDDLVRNSGIDNFDKIIEFLKTKVVFVVDREYKDLIKKAILLLPDPKDAAYLALALRFSIPIWSNDPHLKQQDKIEVFTTEELLNLFSS